MLRLEQTTAHIPFNASILGAAEFFTSSLQGHATVLRHVKNVACMMTTTYPMQGEVIELVELKFTVQRQHQMSSLKVIQYIIDF